MKKLIAITLSFVTSFAFADEVEVSEPFVFLSKSQVREIFYRDNFANEDVFQQCNFSRHGHEFVLISGPSDVNEMRQLRAAYGEELFSQGYIEAMHMQGIASNAKWVVGFEGMDMRTEHTVLYDFWGVDEGVAFALYRQSTLAKDLLEEEDEVETRYGYCSGSTYENLPDEDRPKAHYQKTVGLGDLDFLGDLFDDFEIKCNFSDIGKNGFEVTAKLSAFEETFVWQSDNSEYWQEDVLFNPFQSEVKLVDARRVPILIAVQENFQMSIFMSLPKEDEAETEEFPSQIHVVDLRAVSTEASRWHDGECNFGYGKDN